MIKNRVESFVKGDKMEKIIIKRSLLLIQISILLILFNYNNWNLDYYNYLEIFKKISNEIQPKNIEIGYILLVKSIIYLEGTNSLVRISIGLIGYFIMGRFIFKYIGNYLSIFINYFLYAFYYDINQIRYFLGFSLFVLCDTFYS